MRIRIASLLVLIGLGLIIVNQASAFSAAGDPLVGVVRLDGVIDDVNSRFLSRSIKKATEDSASVLIIRLDTPGGSLSSTRDMVESILSARVPVAVYVSPPGARAASAGTFITAAAHFAVMAPGTNIGAASPIAAGGQDLPETLAKKINEDTQAFIRSIADVRGRNGRALEETVTHARSYSTEEAIALNVVDFAASDLKDLLAQLEGRTADTLAGSVVIRTTNADIHEIDKSLLENFLGIFANPNLAFVLLTIGGLGILAEFLTPGFIGPGVVGAIALALAFVGMGQLPVNWIGAGLILFAMVMFFLEAQEAGLGIFAIGGVICFVLGAFLLFGGYFSSPEIPEPGSRVSAWIIGAFSGAMVVCGIGFLYLLRPTGSATGDYSGTEGEMAGTWGVVTSVLNPSGTVMIGQEEWTATADLSEAIPEGELVTVVEVFGSILKVSRPKPEIEPRRRFNFGKLLGKRKA